jgi:hypothetical protein
LDIYLRSVFLFIPGIFATGINDDICTD